jgi:ABC-2 type transport system permease protein
MSQGIVTPPSLHSLLSPEDEAWVFGRMRYRVVTALLLQTLLRSRFRISIIVVLGALLWSVMFWMTADGFEFLQSTIPHPETYARTVVAMFSMFFAALMLMLIFSAGIILYYALFCSREIEFLLTIPARTERVFLHKFQEAIVLSSWGFVLLGSPLLLAYGVVEHAPWYYYAMLLPFLISFLYIPVAISAIVCLCVVRHLPDSRTAIFWIGGILLALAGVWIAWSLLNGPESDVLTPGWFQEILGRLQFSEKRLLPSWWISSGLLTAAKGNWSESILFLTLLVSNALFFRQVALWTAARIYRTSYSGVHGRSLRRKRHRIAYFDRVVSWSLGFLPAPIRLLLVKDLRIFRRDPLQWPQFFLFLMLLALYFCNIHRLTYDNYYLSWVNMISFLNLAVVGLLLSTFTTRFVFPMISLEGQRFWILGLLPVRRDNILWSKFFFAVVGSIIPCTTLVFLSDMMLQVNLLVQADHQLTCWVLCLGLSGIAVGLSARLPNLRESSPSRIASSFGGTLCLVLSTLFILAVVLLTAMPIHFYLVSQIEGLVCTFIEQSSLQWWLRLWLIAGIGGSVVLGAVATIVPMRIGLRAFRKMEF